MLTLQELKQLVEVPEKDAGVPTAKYMKDCGTKILSRKMKDGAKLTVYQEGYAVYESGKYATVFPVAECGDYDYGMPDEGSRICGEYFDNTAWYIRLFLEGEDRLCRNRESYEREKSISYNTSSGEWPVAVEYMEPVLERMIQEETVKGMLELLTERQHQIICRLYFQQKTQKEISEELGITTATIRGIRSEAIQRIKKRWKAAGENRQSGKGTDIHAG